MRSNWVIVRVHRPECRRPIEGSKEDSQIKEGWKLQKHLVWGTGIGLLVALVLVAIHWAWSMGGMPPEGAVILPEIVAGVLGFPSAWAFGELNFWLDGEGFRTLPSMYARIAALPVNGLLLGALVGWMRTRLLSDVPAGP